MHAVGIHGSVLVTLSCWDSDMFHLFYTISFIPHYKPRTHLEQNKSKQGTHLHITLFTNSKHERTTKLEEMHKSKLLKRLYALLHMQVMKSDFRHPKLTCLPVCYKWDDRFKYLAKLVLHWNQLFLPLITWASSLYHLKGQFTVKYDFCHNLVSHSISL